jgi:hypothetical protein
MDKKSRVLLAADPSGSSRGPAACRSAYCDVQKRTLPYCCALADVALCRRARCRAVALWLAWRSVEAHAAVCCALAGVALCRSARRRAVAPWLAWHSAEARAAVLLLLCAAALFPPGCCGRSAEAHAAAAVLARPGWRRGGRAAWRRRSFLSTGRGGGGAWPELAAAWERPEGASFWARLRRH